MMNQIEKGFVRVGDSGMNYVVFGEGEKPLVIIPGLSFKTVKKFAHPYAFMYRMFGKEYRVYTFDRMEKIPMGYTIKEITDDLASGMESLGISGACVMGVSQGGMAAQYLAVYYPHLVDKLVLAVTISRMNDTARKVIGNWARMAVNNDYQGIVEDMLKVVYSKEYVDRFGKYFPLISRFGKPKDMHRFAILARACLTCNIYDKLDQIQCPTFVIGGKKDLILTGEASEEIAEKLGCEIYMYEELGHSAYEEAADFNGRVLEFFRRS